MKTLPPFYVGQKVVCVFKNTHKPYIPKYNEVINLNTPKVIVDKEYVVTSVVYACCMWRIGVGLGSENNLQGCGHCSKTFPISEVMYQADWFVPIEHKFETISYTQVMEKEQVLTGAN